MKEHMSDRIKPEHSVKRQAKSTDLKKRLYEVGAHIASITQLKSPLLDGAPKRLLNTHYLKPLAKKENLFRSQLIQTPKQSTKYSRQMATRKSPNAFMESSNLQASRTVGNAFATNQQSSLDEYIRLVLRGKSNLDQFLYLVRGKQENIYELELVGFQSIKEKGEYYTVSKKGFCQYVGGKPVTFIQVEDWAREKAIYEKIKSLKFFNRFRRWKTVQMWKKTVVKHRIQACAASLEEKLFLLSPPMRKCLLSLRQGTLELEKSVLVISRNQASYSLQSFKHCQERARRQTAMVVQQFSRKARDFVRNCFEGRLNQLREGMKKSGGDQRGVGLTASHSPKDNAFQALGFPARMSYEHRSRLRKEAARFIRFSYLVDSLHLTCLAATFTGQLSNFLERLEEIQIREPVRSKNTLEDPKNPDDLQRERMFTLQLGCSFKDVPPKIVGEIDGESVWAMKLKGEEGRKARRWVPKICDYWLSMRPSPEEVGDELSFLLKEGLNSLRYFERWSRHRQMQKYVGILQEWDEVVSQNWQVSENENLDPLAIMDGLEPNLGKLKGLIRSSEVKLNESVNDKLGQFLNAHWQLSQTDVSLLENEELESPAQTLQQFLTYASRMIERCSIQIPQRLDLGIFSLQLTRVKSSLIQFLVSLVDRVKTRFPEIIEGRVSRLNQWLFNYGGRLREEILNIDDYVRTVKVVREVEGDLGNKREVCNDLAQLYQAMQNFKMDTRRRKDFQSVTLKLKDQLEQLVTTTEQSVDRKADLYMKEVLKYHLPNLLKDIQRQRDALVAHHFLSLDAKAEEVVAQLTEIRSHEEELRQRKNKCQEYISSLRLNQNPLQELDDLSNQITYRLQLWQNRAEWANLTLQFLHQSVRSIDLKDYFAKVVQFRENIQKLKANLPPNQVLETLQTGVQEHFINVPLLQGFREELSESHWEQIQSLVPRLSLDLKKGDFSLAEFLKSGVGNRAKQMQGIFQKCKVQGRLQRQYHEVQQTWGAMLAKSKTEGRFVLICNQENIREELDALLGRLTIILSNPYAQSLKQYSVTYDSVAGNQRVVEGWLKAQEGLVNTDRTSRLLDIKKLPDYNHFETAQRLYKQLSKPFLNKNAENGVKLAKLLLPGTEDRLVQIQTSLAKVQANITSVLNDHRRAYPPYYLFCDSALLKAVTDSSRSSIEEAAKRVICGLGSVEFEGERIVGLVTVDGQRFGKGPISIGEMEQVLWQIGQTMYQANRRAMRACHYKTVESSPISLTETHNIQHLLAVDRVDFTNYTEISIDNQSDAPDALREFLKVMRRDTTDDIRRRPSLSTACQLKYDTLLLQHLLHQQVLSSLLNAGVTKVTDFEWSSQLRFSWEDSGSTDQHNITVRQLHVTIKYGSDFIGSRSKALIAGDLPILATLRFGESSLYSGPIYALERIFNAMGCKSLLMPCSDVTPIKSLRNFLLGCHYADFLPIITGVDLLGHQTLNKLLTQQWVTNFREGLQKKTSPYIKDNEGKMSPVFLTVRGSQPAVAAFRGQLRVLDYSRPNESAVRCAIKIMRVCGRDAANLLTKLFQLVYFLEQKSTLQGVSLEEFLDQGLQRGDQPDQATLLSHLLAYLKPRINLNNFTALQQHIESIWLVPGVKNEQLSERQARIDTIKETLLERRVLVLAGRGSSKRFALQQALYPEYIIDDVFAECLSKQELAGIGEQKSFFEKLLSDSTRKRVIYCEGSSEQLLLALERLLFLSPSLRQALFRSQTYFVVATPTLEKIADPGLLSSFPVLSYEWQRQYMNDYATQWAQNSFDPEPRRAFLRLFKQAVLPTFDTLGIKDEVASDEKMHAFFRVLESILPVQYLSEAVAYCLACVLKGPEDEAAKLDYLMRRQIGQDRLPEGTRMTSIVYSKLGSEGLLEQSAHLNLYLQSYPFNHPQLVLTGETFHLLTLTKGLLGGKSGVYLEGARLSGKSTLLRMFRELNHGKSAYLRVMAGWGCKSQMLRQLGTVVQRHSLNVMGPKINYEQTIVMVQDVEMPRIQRQKLILLHQMLRYQLFPMEKESPKQLRQVKLLMTGAQIPEIFAQSAYRMKVELPEQKLKRIFANLLKEALERQSGPGTALLERILTSTFELCQRLGAAKTQFRGAILAAQKRVYLSFSRLKIRQGSNIPKEVQKFWGYSLQQCLSAWGKQGVENTLKRTGLVAGSLYSHLGQRGEGMRRLESIRDPKKLYNILNERIEKYNQSENRRYGGGFQFLNFDQVLRPLLRLSNSLLTEADHVLCGRSGTGKLSLSRLAAYLNGVHFRQTGTISLPTLTSELLADPALTPYLLSHRLANSQDVAQLVEFYMRDFEELGGSREARIVRIAIKQFTKGTRINNFGSSVCDSYVPVIPKPSLQELNRLRSSLRIVVTTREEKLLLTLPEQVLANLRVDFLEQVPVEAVIQYNQRLLAVDEIQCGQHAQSVLAQIFQWSRVRLGASLRANDDCVRLFSSFLSNLINQMVLEKDRWARVPNLHTRLADVCSEVAVDVQETHEALKELSLRAAQGEETAREAKSQAEAKLREKSTLLANAQRLLEMLGWLLPSSSQKLAATEGWLEDRSKLQELFAVTACYFTLLSGLQFAERRKILNQWYTKVEALRGSAAIQSFLPLFLLHEEQFNAQPIDELQDFYQNMAIIFHSVKPIVLADESRRGRAWLEKNCAFICISEEQPDFLDSLAENLSKATNILLQVTRQATIDSLPESLIHALLYLSDTTSTISIKGEDVVVNREAKVYLLLGEGVNIPPQLLVDFTLVAFTTSAPMFEKALEHEFMSNQQKEPYFARMEALRKLRNLRLDCENAGSQLADSIHEQLASADDPSYTNLCERISRLTDKIMVRAQNQFTKLREKADMIKELVEKAEKSLKKLDFTTSQALCTTAQAASQALQIFTARGGYFCPPHHHYLAILRLAVNRKLVTGVGSLLVFILRQWAPQFTDDHYLAFAFILITTQRGLNTDTLLMLTSSQKLRDGSLANLIRSDVVSREAIQNWVIRCLIEMQEGESLAWAMAVKDTPLTPPILTQNLTHTPRIILVLGNDLTRQTLKRYVSSQSSKALQVPEEQNLQSYLKKNASDDLELIVYGQATLAEVHKHLLTYGLAEKTTIYCGACNSVLAAGYAVDLNNKQGVFQGVINSFNAGRIEESSNILNLLQQSQTSSNDPLQTIPVLLAQYLRVYYRRAGLQPPYLNFKELIQAKRLFDGESSLSCIQKLQLILKWAQTILHDNDYPIEGILESLFLKLLALPESSEEEYFCEIGKIIKCEQEPQKGQETKLVLLETGWLRQLRYFLGYQGSDALKRMAQQVETLQVVAGECSRTPKVHRTTKRQLNLKGRRGSHKKPNMSLRQSLKDKKPQKEAPKRQVEVLTQNLLAVAYLQRESEAYEGIIRSVNFQLAKMGDQVASGKVSRKTIERLVQLQNDQAPSEWRLRLIAILGEELSLNASLRQLVARRNQLHTYLSKLAVSGTCEVAFHLLSMPIQFLKAYFRSDLQPSAQEYFFLASQLSPEEIQKSQYLRVSALWSVGWRLSSEGMLEPNGDTKPTLLSHFYLTKRGSLPSIITTTTIQVFLDGDSKESCLRVVAPSKKSQLGSPLHLYLRKPFE